MKTPILGLRALLALGAILITATTARAVSIPYSLQFINGANNLGSGVATFVDTPSVPGGTHYDFVGVMNLSGGAVWTGSSLDYNPATGASAWRLNGLFGSLVTSFIALPTGLSPVAALEANLDRLGGLLVYRNEAVTVPDSGSTLALAAATAAVLLFAASKLRRQSAFQLR